MSLNWLLIAVTNWNSSSSSCFWLCCWGHEEEEPAWDFVAWLFSFGVHDDDVGVIVGELHNDNTSCFEMELEKTWLELVSKEKLDPIPFPWLRLILMIGWRGWKPLKPNTYPDIDLCIDFTLLGVIRMSTPDTVTQQSTRHGSRVCYPLHTWTFPTQKPYPELLLYTAATAWMQKTRWRDLNVT